MSNSNRITGVMALAVTVALLGGCSVRPNGEAEAVTPSSNYPITVRRDSSSLQVAVAPGQYRMSEEQKAEIEWFASSYSSRGHGPLMVAAPSGSGNAGAARAAVARVVDVLENAGIAQDRIQLSSYPASGDQAPVTLSYDRFAAEASPCDDVWARSSTETRQNEVWSSMGCATQQNLAAMVSDPMDLVRMRAMTHGDAQRRDEVFAKYRRGEPSGATRSEDERASTTE